MNFMGESTSAFSYANGYVIVILGNVLQERRRELTCHGLRWMDQRRLANDPDFPTQTVTRVFKGTTYTLEPGAVRYTFPMGEKYLEENPEIGQIK